MSRFKSLLVAVLLVVSLVSLGCRSTDRHEQEYPPPYQSGSGGASCH